jgi:HPr kinase/phosphorylase
MPLTTPLSIRELFDDNLDALSLAWLAGQTGTEQLIVGDAVSAADQIGHLNLIHPGRIQVFGPQEMAYLARISEHSRIAQTRELVAGKPPAFIIAHSLTPPPFIVDVCNDHGIPLISTPHPSARVIDYLRVYLSKKLATRVTMHGVFMDVLGVGVLITGESGLGKSELGLELISRNHGLVADDAVEFSRIAPNMIEGRCPPLLQNLLEVRGLGRDCRAPKDAAQADCASGATQDTRRKLRAPAAEPTARRSPGSANTKGRDTGGSRSQHRGAAGSCGTQHDSAITRHRHTGGFHGTPAARNG